MGDTNLDELREVAIGAVLDHDMQCVFGAVGVELAEHVRMTQHGQHANLVLGISLLACAQTVEGQTLECHQRTVACALSN